MKNSIVLFLLCCSFQTFSQVVTWTGHGDDLNWEDPDNWDLDRLPMVGKAVVLYNNDSVVVSTSQTISKLEIQSGGILYQRSPTNSVEFIITNNGQNGIEVYGGGKLYLNGITKIQNVGGNGILIRVNAEFIGMANCDLTIEDTGADAIKSDGVKFTNAGEIHVKDFYTDGFDVKHFTNSGAILIEAPGSVGMKIAGGNGLNSGTIDSELEIRIQTSTLFINSLSGEIIPRSTLVVSSDFENNGLINCLSETASSLTVSSSSSFLNNKIVQFGFSAASNLVISGASEFINEKEAVLKTMPTGHLLEEDIYVIDISDFNSGFFNSGLVDLKLLGSRQGVKLTDRAQLRNRDLGDFIIEDFLDFGVYAETVSQNTTTIINEKTGFFEIGQGENVNSVALLLGERNRFENEHCADFVIKDSIYLDNVAVTLVNEGFLEIEKFRIPSSANVYNEGVIYLADVDLAVNFPSGYVDEIDNDGLIYCPRALPFVPDNEYSSFFVALGDASVDAVNKVSELLSGGIYQESGGFDFDQNAWIPNSAAIGADSIYFTYQRTDLDCEARKLVVPFINLQWDCTSAPPAIVTFSGNVSDDWFVQGNWSNNQIPRPCDSVIIPSGKNCEVAAGETAEASKITIASGAVFNTQSSSVLSVNPN
jgi:hypothetical protein